jgi:trimeric autotransporter adhesin
MSKISLAPDASGSGIFTIASPNSNTNRTLTLPDDTGTLALTSAALTGTTDSGTPFETALGTDAGAVNTGVNNTFVGFEAGNDNTSGTNNTALGYQALDVNTTGASNTAVGSGALGVNTTGAENTAVGAFALDANTTGIYNTALGVSALGANTTSTRNTALGYASLSSNTIGEENVAVGRNALLSHTGGSFNVAVGHGSMANGNGGSNNAACGYEALQANTGSNNTAVGYRSLLANTTGTANTAVGYQAGDSITTGVAHTAIGYGALSACTTGIRNAAIGYECFINLTTGSSNVGIGDNPNDGNIFNVTSENNRGVFGHNSITNAYVKVAWTVTSDARDKTSIESVPHGLSFVQQLNPVSYRWKTSREDDTPHGNRRYGFLAQEVMALEGNNPVIIDDEQPDHLKYQGEALVPVLVNAIKELSAQVTALQAEVNTLKGQ